MKNKTTINWVISTLIILLFLVVPNEVVWGGNNIQTVPTLGPSRTATTAKTATQVAPTNTQVASTQPANTNPTSTNTSQSVVQPTTINTLEPTATQAVATETTQGATGNEQVVSTETSVKETEATSSVSLPLVSVNEEDEKAADPTSDESSQPEVITTLPSFVLPMLAVLLLVIVYLIIRITSKKTSDKK